MSEDTYNVSPDLESLLIDITLIDLMPINPRRGDVDAIAGSYKQFGQQKPISLLTLDNGRFLALAGNHQVMAARDRLGWTHIAGTVTALSEEDALAFSIIDNRFHELGTTDHGTEYKIIQDFDNDYGDVFDAVGWDDFKIATMEDVAPAGEPLGSWTPPVIDPEALTKKPVSNTTDEEPDLQYPSDDTTDAKEIISLGSVSDSQNTNASVQFTLVFENAGDQAEFYNFIRWLMANKEYTGGTIASKVLDFVNTHRDIT